jgi:serine/threonine-protein kinase HipA
MVVARVALGNGLVPVGRLVFETDGRRAHSTFIYDREWIDNPCGFDLCPQMPRASAPYHTSSGGRDSRKRDVIAGPFADTSPDLGRRGIGDVYTLTVREFQSKGWIGRLAYRIYRHPVVLFGVGPAYEFLLRYRLVAHGR